MQSETDIAQAWRSFSDARRSRLLQKMTPEQKQSLRRAIQGARQAATDSRKPEPSPGWWQRVESRVQSATQPTDAYPGPPTTISSSDPAMAEAGLNTIKRAARVVFGTLDFGPTAFSALRDALSSDPERSADGETRLLEMHPGAQILNRLRELREDIRHDPKLAAANVLGDAAGVWLAGRVMEVPGKAAEGLPAIRRAVAERYGPRAVPLAGVDVPVSVGEAAPETGPGRFATRLKRSGVSGEKFERLEREQVESVKRVIRNVAQQTSELIGPMKNEPGEAMSDAAEATFRAARPMWKALDSSLVTIPDRLDMVSKLTQQAISQAQKLGVDVTDPEVTGEYYVDRAGNPVDRASMSPARFEDAVNRGDITTAKLVEGQPIGVYMRVRSRLLKMQRATADPALRNSISEQVRGMNDAMQSTLKGSPLADVWAQANRLWSRGYALRVTADAIKRAARGTPAVAQAPGISSVPTKLQGARLVSELNRLADVGVLDRGFAPEEVANLRQAADILDRIQRTPVGKGWGESMSISRGLRHAVSGARAPMIGAAVGAAAGGLRGAEVGAGIGLVVQAVGERMFARMMATVPGVEALRLVESAGTASQMQTALQALATAAAASGVARKPRPLRELRDEAQRRKPAPESPALALQGR